MADAPTLELRIQSDSDKAIQSLQALGASLDALKKKLSGDKDTGFIAKIGQMGQSLKTAFTSELAANIDKTAAALERIAGIKGLKNDIKTAAPEIAPELEPMKPQESGVGYIGQETAEIKEQTAAVKENAQAKLSAVQIMNQETVERKRALTLQKNLLLNAKLEQQIQKLRGQVSAPAEGAAKSMKETKKSAFDLGKTFDKLMSPLGKVVRAFNRILFYRVIRNILKQIGQGFKEGIANVREYSRAIDGTFNKAMTGAEDSLFKMKNSLGAALAPALELLIPVLQRIVSWFITLVNYANQFLALLGGKSSWTRATDASASSLDKVKKSAGGAAKEVKNLLAGFDELNIIQSESGGGSGGGAGSPAVDYTKMFEEVTVFDEKVKSVVEWIKRNGPLILGVVSAIGAAFATWRISKAFNKDLWDSFKILVGLGVAIYGVVVAVRAFTDQWENGVDFGNMRELLKGVGLVALGLGIAFGVVGFGIGMIGGGIALAINPIKEFIETGTLSEAALSQLGWAAIFAGVGITALATRSLKAAIGVGIALYGLIKAVQDVKTQWDNGVTFENMKNLFGDLAIIAGGLAFGFGLTGLGVGLLIDAVLAAIGPIKELIETGELSAAAADQLGWAFVLAASGVTLLATRSLKAGLGIGLAAYAMVEAFKEIKNQWDNGVTFENMTSLTRKLGLMVLGLGVAFGTKGIGAGAVIVGLAEMVAPLKELVEVGSLSEESFKQLEIGIGLITAGLTTLTGNPWVLVIGGIIAGITALIHYWPQIVEWWNDEALPWLQDTWESFKKQPVVKPIIDGLEYAITEISELIADPQAWWDKKWSALTKWVSDVWTELGTTISKKWEELRAEATAFWESMVESSPELKRVVDWFDSIKETIKEIADDPLGWFSKKWDTAIESISKEWNKFTAELERNARADAFLGPIITFAEQTWPKVVAFFTDPLGTIGSAFEYVGKKAGEFWESLVQSDPALKQTIEWFSAAIEEIRNFFADPLGYASDKWTQVTSALGEWWAGVIEEIDTKVRADKFLGPLIEGIEAAWPKILAFMQDPIGAVQEAWDGLKKWFHNNIVVPLNNFFVGIANGAIGVINNIIRALNSVSFDIFGQHVGFNLEELDLLPLMEETEDGDALELPVSLVPVEESFTMPLPDMSNYDDFDLNDYLYDPENDLEISFTVDEESFAQPIPAPDVSGVTDATGNMLRQVTSDVDATVRQFYRLSGLSFSFAGGVGGGGGAGRFGSLMFRANGGFVGNGDLFMAREAGPELVGRIGSRTAVANNDQIVAGVAGGVAAGQAEQNSLLRQQNDLLRQMLNKSGNVEAIPSAAWGRFIKRSTEMYATNAGT